MADAPPFWMPEGHADRRPILKTRGRVKAALRGDFEAQGFTEVEAGILQTSPGNEAHLHGFATHFAESGGPPQPLYLHTSPEFALKKLLAAGETRIFDFARVFRNGERSALHHPEFTMLEWYRAAEPYESLFADCVSIVRCAAEAASASKLTFRGRTTDPFAEPERLTVTEAFARYACVDLLASVSENGTDRDHLAAQARAAGIRVAEDDVWADIFSRILVACVEPNLGLERPTILCEYPTAEAALARRSAHDARVAERFEFYACGVELANGFGELTDPVEQRTRFEAEMTEKQRVYGETYPLDEDFLAALAHIPDAAGCALGFDRLVMLATGANHIEQVIWTPMAR
jgi:lysyl-tRNA synthetase class 2